MTSSTRRPWNIRQWDVWALPPRLLSSVLLIEALAVALLIVDVLVTPLSAYAPIGVIGSTLVIGGVVHAEVSMRLERIRRRVVGEAANIDLSSVWTFAAALLLPPPAASAAIIVLFTYLYLRVWRPAKVPPFRQIFTTATLLLAVHAAAAVMAYVSFGASQPLRTGLGPLVIVLALLAFTVVNTCLVVGIVIISANKTVREVLGQGDEIVLEVATLSLGGLVALAVSTGGPLLVAFALPPLLVLHRAVLVRQLEKAANTDGKTGLLTAAAWHQRSTERLKRAREHEGSAGVLILDLDHFKRVNDDYGHLAGDVVLKAVATALREEVRDHDLVGRFGGEEFVMLLPHPESRDYSYADLRATAERIRRSISRLGVEIATPDGPLTIGGLSISIGGAIFPGDGSVVQDLVAVADSALYAAKRDGRNTVRLGQHQNRELTLPHVTPAFIESDAPSS
ncbi:GGDEF domain-containing protein [Pseudonocardia sp. GCM10023141]|uniref:GGDEF domain-containing protein n=1 Tax=Pseudonocardia sp. GCM10023141 TaxID=3252653 RepID=UPI00361CF8E7